MVATAFWRLIIHALKFQGDPQEALKFVTVVLFGVAVIWAAYRFVDVIDIELRAWASGRRGDLDDQLIPLFSKTLRIFVILLGSLALVQNLGFNVMSLLTGLGGLAFALAAKDTAANLFGSVVILMDRPFHIGDWVLVTDGEGDVEGLIDAIGFRSTRIRTFYNSPVSLPNSVVAAAKIDNMQLRQSRRIKKYVSLTYDTDPEEIEAFCEGLKQILLANPCVDKDRITIFFNRFSSSSLDILLYCFLKVDSWDEELYQRQNIFLEILKLAKGLRVNFAFPSQTPYVETFPEKNLTRYRPT